MRRPRDLLRRGLERTAALWPDVGETHRWLHAAAHILANGADHPAAVVQARYDRLIAAWSTRRDQATYLADLEARACQQTLPT